MQHLISKLLPVANAGGPQTAEDVLGVFRKIVNYVGDAFWIAAVAAVLYAGFLYLTAGGEAEKVKKASKMLWYAVIAIAVGLMAQTLPKLVENILSVGPIKV